MIYDPKAPALEQSYEKGIEPSRIVPWLFRDFSADIPFHVDSETRSLRFLEVLARRKGES